ncbi:MAG: exodeoxyribonuclease VII small subunit [Clostridia bacterium]|nr:exodeoxyribonuclease VII small subunit [Clostridia bacterium]MBR6005148.1 exodeoxyribonuclease VII small subunit [Clostridia bacterium]
MENFNFEKAVEKLEKTVEKLEKGDLSLDEMMKLYEEGVSLSSQCSKALDEAEFKITELSAKGNTDE